MAAPWEVFQGQSAATPAPATFDDSAYAPASSSQPVAAAPGPAAPAASGPAAPAPAQPAAAPWTQFAGSGGSNTAAPHPLDAYPAAAPSSADPSSGYRFVAPYPAPDGRGLTTVDPAQFADFAAGKPAPSVPDGKISGLVANAAAGPNTALATMLGAPMDLSNGIRNIAVRGINYIAGTSIPQTDAVGGSADVKRAFGIVGANPDNVVAATPTESLVRSATEGATMALAPELGGAALVGTGLATAGKVAPVVEKLGGLTAGNVAAGAASGVGANAAAALAPDAWKPVAGVVGGLVGGGVGGLTVAGTKSAGNALTGLGDSMGLSTRNALSDASGTVLRDTAGNPVTATDAQAAAGWAAHPGGSV